jgi:hypothetical protein
MKALFALIVLSTAVGAQSMGDLTQQFPENALAVKSSQYGGYQRDKDRLPEAPGALTRKFLFAHGVYLASNVFDIEMTHQGLAHGKCLEGGFDGSGRPSRGELYAKDMSVFAIITGMDWMFAKLHPPKAFQWMPFMGSTQGTIVHLRGGINWYRRCW